MKYLYARIAFFIAVLFIVIGFLLTISNGNGDAMLVIGFLWFGASYFAIKCSDAKGNKRK